MKLKEKKVKITEIKKRRVKKRIDMRYIKSLLVLCCLLAASNTWAMLLDSPEFLNLFDSSDRSFVDQQIAVISGSRDFDRKSDAYEALFDRIKERRLKLSVEDFNYLFSLLKIIASDISKDTPNTDRKNYLREIGDSTGRYPSDLKFDNQLRIDVRFLQSFKEFNDMLKKPDHASRPSGRPVSPVRLSPPLLPRSPGFLELLGDSDKRFAKQQIAVIIGPPNFSRKLDVYVDLFNFIKGKRLSLGVEDFNYLFSLLQIIAFEMPKDTDRQQYLKEIGHETAQLPDAAALDMSVFSLPSFREFNTILKNPGQMSHRLERPSRSASRSAAGPAEHHHHHR